MVISRNQFLARFLTEKEAADALLVKRETLRKWRRQGCGPRYIRCGKRLVRYFLEDIEAWLLDKQYSSHASELSQKKQK